MMRIQTFSIFLALSACAAGYACGDAAANGLAAFLIPSTVQAPIGHGSVSVMEFNVGTAAIEFRDLSKQPNCPNYKLCKPRVIQKVAKYIADSTPDALMIEESQGLGQLTGTEHGGPVLPTGYQAQCAFGSFGVQEVCLAWNTARASLSGSCRSFSLNDGGAIVCPLTVDGQEIQFLAAHPSGHHTKEQVEVMKAIWSVLLDRQQPAIVGGDFNTEKGTLGFSPTLPYPAEFGTLFGENVPAYGRWSGSDSFFGHYHVALDGSRKPGRHNTTVFHRNLDQVFANFGTPDPSFSARASCPSYSSIGRDQFGLRWPRQHLRVIGELGWDLDHIPILSWLSW